MIPAWVDRREYPFEPRTLDVDGGRLSYVDEGEGAPIVMVHGQARNLARLIETLTLKDLTLVVHDYGGPIGLAYAIDHPENVGDRRMEWFGRILGGPLGRFLYERVGFSVRVMLRHAIADHRRYTRGTERHYLKALDGHATWVYAREVLGSSAWYDGLWRQRDRIARIPALLIWGMKDPAFGRYLGRWREVFERAEVVELPDCGHAPTEERAPEALKRLAPFLERQGGEE